jgi:putative hydrolase of the HAD superfamily
MEDKPNIRAVLFDFGGVVAEEGFQQGLYAIAERFRLNKKDFFRLAADAVYSSGYVTGTGSEADYWQTVREKTGITAPDNELRHEVLSRFIPRPWLLEIVRTVKTKGCIVAILSDQSDWLDQLEARYHFFKEFDAVFNSYHVGKSKRDPTFFDDTVQALGVTAGQTLFVDDNQDHIQRAAGRGLQTHLFTTRAALEAVLQRSGLPV